MSGPAQLRTVAEPKLGGTFTLPAAIFQLAELADMTDSLSFVLQVIYTGGAALPLVDLAWSLDDAGTRICWLDTIPLEGGGTFNVQGPVRGPFVRLKLRATTASDSVFLALFGTNLVLDRLDWQNAGNGTTWPVPQAPGEPTRATWTAFVAGLAATSVEAVATMAMWREGTTSSAASYTIPTLRRLRITAVLVNARGAAAGSTVTVRLREGSTTAGDQIAAFNVSVAPNVTNPTPVPIPDGLELDAQQFCLTAQTGATGQTVDVTLVGYEIAA